MSKKKGISWYISILFSIIALLCLLFVISIFFFSGNISPLRVKIPQRMKKIKAKKSEKIEKIINKLKNKKEMSGEYKKNTYKIEENELNEYIKYLIEKNHLKERGLKNFFVFFKENKMRGLISIKSNLKSAAKYVDVQFEGHFKKAGDRTFFQVESIKIGKIPLMDGLKEKFLKKILKKNNMLDLYSRKDGIMLPEYVKDVKIRESYLSLTISD